MLRSVTILGLCGAAAICAAEDAVEIRLPAPDYQPAPSDPAWLVAVVQFHGHLGPSVVAGARLGAAGLRAVGAKGYFDVEVTCAGPFAQPPQACFLDGIQVATGATLGKRTLHWAAADGIAVTVKNIRSGRIAELYPTPLLSELLTSFKPQAKAVAKHQTERREAHQRLEALARKIAFLPEKELLTIKIINDSEHPHGS
jgi:formylmethanofuran dehydrogenase subunit E